MNFIKTEIPDVFIIEPKVWLDERGYFFESFKDNLFKKNIGEINFIQDNESKSPYGIIRGLHYQIPPFAQSKLIRVIKGKILDVAVDIRRGSPTFSKQVAIELSEENKRQLFIPKGFAHGFSVLSSECIVNYKVDGYYKKEAERGIRFDDKTLNIDWKINKNDTVVCERDKNFPYIDKAEIF
ncbi:MAG: dTDP-4-dehydrorhamnose 3,5-epimerase [bacterium]|nr:dTDP-4-dehydrorhamnose 3,5-epimerase [bacterium]